MPENWKIVLVSTLPQDIYLARSYLESEGIDTWLKDELTAQVQNFYSNAIGGVKLMVQAADAGRARDLLTGAGYIVPGEENRSLRIETVRTANRTHCPYCGSDNIARQKQGDWLMLVFYAFLGVLFPVFRRVHICFDCGKSWRFRPKR